MMVGWRCNSAVRPQNVNVYWLKKCKTFHSKLVNKTSEDDSDILVYLKLFSKHHQMINRVKKSLKQKQNLTLFLGQYFLITRKYPCMTVSVTAFIGRPEEACVSILH